MSKTIWKFTLAETDTQIISAPKYARFISADVQENKLVVWAMVFPHEPDVDYTIRIFGTGHPIPDRDNLIYIDSVKYPPFVWHIFLEDNNATI